MRPLPARFMPGAAARHRVNAALTLMSKMMFQSASETSSTGLNSCPATPPASFTSTSIAQPVCVSIAWTHAAPAARSRRSTVLVTIPPGAAVSASSSADRSVANTRAPRPGETLRDGTAETVPRAGHRNHLVIETDIHAAALSIANRNQIVIAHRQRPLLYRVDHRDQPTRGGTGDAVALAMLRDRRDLHVHFGARACAPTGRARRRNASWRCRD